MLELLSHLLWVSKPRVGKAGAILDSTTAPPLSRAQAARKGPSYFPDEQKVGSATSELSAVPCMQVDVPRIIGEVLTQGLKMSS